MVKEPFLLRFHLFKSRWSSNCAIFMAASFHFASLLTPISAMQNVRLSDIMIYEAMDIVL